jgi:Protein of unknown function (DUF664).
MAENEPEAWLRGPLAGVPPVVTPLFFTFTQVREDLERHTSGLTTDDVWRRVGNTAPLGFHLRHIPGSVDRLLTYLEERSLSEEQLQALKQELSPGADVATLLGEMRSRFENAEHRLKNLSFDDLHAPRYIGRKRLPTTVLGLLVHIAEHTQRHLGQAITTTKLLKNSTE